MQRKKRISDEFPVDAMEFRLAVDRRTLLDRDRLSRHSAAAGDDLSVAA
jgi:hypothetical protein